VAWLALGIIAQVVNRRRAPRLWFAIRVAFIALIPFLLFNLAKVIGPFARTEAMVNDSFETDRRQPYSVSVAARQWEGLYRHPIHNPGAGEELPPDHLASAVAEAIRQSGVFASVAPEAAAFRLEVVIMKLNVPWHLFPTIKTNVDVALSWRLIDASQQRVVFEELILTSHAATMHDLIGAVEAATRENMRIGIHRLSRLKL
jgi:hypothetical protein